MISEESVAGIPDIATMQQKSNDFKPTFLATVMNEINTAIAVAAAGGYNQVNSPWYTTEKTAVGAGNWNNRLLPDDIHDIIAAYEAKGYKASINDYPSDNGITFKISW